MKTLLLALATLLPLAQANADCDPPGLLRIVSANVSPGLPKDSFARKPVIAYRAGNGRLRTEEMANPAAGVHQLHVINWPDVWIVNLLDKTGQHIVEDSPKSGLQVTLLDTEPPLEIPPAWASLEFGCEWEFFAANKATRTPTEKHNATKHQLTEGAWRLTLVTAPDSQVPMALMLSEDNNVIYAIAYFSYEHRDEVDPALFAKPEGIRFEEPLK